jgi:hypothetical protein
MYPRSVIRASTSTGMTLDRFKVPAPFFLNVIPVISRDGTRLLAMEQTAGTSTATVLYRLD